MLNTKKKDQIKKSNKISTSPEHHTAQTIVCSLNARYSLHTIYMKNCKNGEIAHCVRLIHWL